MLLPFKLSGKPEKLQEGNTAVDWHLIYGVEATLLEVSWRDKFWKIGYVADITDSVLSCCKSSYLSRGGGGTPIWNRRGCSSEILNLTPKGDHLGVAQAFCDP